MKKQISFLILIAVLFSYCKKADDSPIFVPSRNVYGFFYSQTTKFVGLPRDSTVQYAGAYFSSTPRHVGSVITSSNKAKLGSVILNGDTLRYNYDTTYVANNPNILGKVVWQVTGTDSISAFSYTNFHNIPAWTTICDLPDTIYRNKGFLFWVRGVNNRTYGTVLIYQTAYNYYYDGPNKYIKNGDQTIRFNAHDLWPVETSENVTIEVLLENAHLVNFNGKYFQFAKFTKLVKQNVILVP